MGVRAIFSVKATNWYDEVEAQGVLDDVVKIVQGEDSVKNRWIVLGFQFGIGSHYLLTVFSDLETWPETLDKRIASIRAIEPGATVHNYSGSKQQAWEDINQNTRKFSVEI
ncbi:hypothetical protein RAB80_017009 [Fusarium oxysporum f. sp. vasinfectum]|nr:hypothetical protein RAB80_017009 [Fusarium oxysporum f. sp. vasinfectum]